MTDRTAGHALHDWVLPVSAHDRPPYEVAWLRARDVVFAVHEPPAADGPVDEGAFLGVVAWSAAVGFPARIFADLLPDPAPDPVSADLPLEQVLERFERDCCGALPVFERGRFRGAVTRSSVAESLVGGGVSRGLDHARWQRALARLHSLESQALRAEELSHDLANTLHSVVNLAGLMARQSTPELADDLGLLLEAARRGRGLLDRLRATHDDEHHLEEVRADGVLEGVARQARLLLPLRIEVVVEAGDPDLRFQVDRTDLERMLANLVTNARDATPGEGTLTLGLDALVVEAGARDVHGRGIAPGGWVRLSVTDSGHGMDEALQREVFQPRFSTRADRGRGLGLSTVLRLVRRNHGALRCSSRPGHGTTFELLFRRVDAEAS